MESVHTDEINYEYILSLIQAFIPEEENEARTLDEKDIKAIAVYISELAKTNSGLAAILNNLWLQIQINPEKYRGQSVSNILDNMIEDVIKSEVKKMADEWFIGFNELMFVVKNYRKGQEHQRGEQELVKSQDYRAYKAYKEEQGETPLNKIQYKRAVRLAYPKAIEEIIGPLQCRR